jgi:hypothetical protein
MEELKTFLTPVSQLFFFFILAIIWVAGFIRQRNLGFLFLALASLATAALNVIRQAIVNTVIFHSGNVPVTQRSTTIEIITLVMLILFILLWLMMIIGALLVVFYRPKPRQAEVAPPPG